MTLLVTDLEWGGAPLLVYSLAQGLRECGWQVRVAALGRPGPVGRKLETEGIPVCCCEADGVGDVGDLLRLGSMLRHDRPHVLQTFLMHANVTGRVLGRLNAVPVVVSEICTAEKEAHWHLLLERMTARLADRIICNSASVLAHMRSAGLPKEKLVTIEHGVDLDLLRGPHPAPAGLPPTLGNRVLFVGRLDPVKGLATLVQAWRIVQSKMPTAELVIAGDGPERTAFAALKNVRLLGFRPDIPALLQACDLFVLPSRWEGFGLAAAEAMAAGVPVVLTRVEGLRDLVVDGVDGRLVESENPGALAEAIMELLQDEVQRQKLSQAGYLTATRRFDRRRMVQDHDRLYRQLLTSTCLDGRGVIQWPPLDLGKRPSEP